MNEKVEGIKNNNSIILININKLYKKEMSTKDLYEATRQHWRVNIDRASKIKIACSVFRGIIKEVFIIRKWLPSQEAKGRYLFEGNIASLEIRQKYINKSVAQYWKKGSRYPIKYIDADI